MTKQQPVASIIVPVKNVATWITDCLLSIQAQTLSNFEVILIDDGSDDDSVALCQTFVSEDPRFSLHHATGQGSGAARNQGVALATGKFLTFVDSDDIVPPHALESLVSAQQQTGSPVVMGQYVKFSGEQITRSTSDWGVFGAGVRKTTLKETPALLLSRSVWNKLFLRSFWNENRISFPNVVRSNDIVPSLRAFMDANSIGLTDSVVYIYRDRPGTSSMSNKAKSLTGLKSNLQQEWHRWILVRDSADKRLADEFLFTFFNRDGWFHIHRAIVAGIEEADADLAECSIIIRRLLQATGPKVRRRLTDYRLNLFLILASQELWLFEYFYSTDTRKAAQLGISKPAVEKLISTIPQLKLWANNPVRLRDSLVSQLILGPLQRVTPEVSADELVDFVQLSRSLLLQEYGAGKLSISRFLKTLSAEQKFVAMCIFARDFTALRFGSKLNLVINPLLREVWHEPEGVRGEISFDGVVDRANLRVSLVEKGHERRYTYQHIESVRYEAAADKTRVTFSVVEPKRRRGGPWYLVLGMESLNRRMSKRVFGDSATVLSEKLPENPVYIGSAVHKPETILVRRRRLVRKTVGQRFRQTKRWAYNLLR